MSKTRAIDFSYAPDKSQVCIGLVDDPIKTVLWDDGSIAFGYEQSADPYYYRLMKQQFHSKQLQNRGFRYRFQPVILHRDTLLKRYQDYGDPQAAIVTTIEEYTHSVFSCTSFAYRSGSGMRADVMIWSLIAKSTFCETRSGVALAILGEEHGAFRMFASPVCRNDCARPEFLCAGGTMSGAFFIVHQGTFSQEQVTLTYAQSALRWAQSYWESVVPFEKRFFIPDVQIRQMLASCGRNILQAREIHDAVPTYQVGPTCYRGLWIVDGLFILEAVHMMGRSREAFDGLLALLKRVRPDGSIQAIPFHEKETAIAIYTIIKQCELMGDTARLQELWPTIQRAFHHLSLRIEASYEYGQDFPARGLFPPSYGDGGINGLEPEYTTPLWVMTGLSAASRVAHVYHLPGAETMRQCVDQLMKHYLAAIKRDRTQTADGIPCVYVSMLTPQQVAERIENHDVYDVDGEVCNWGGYTPQCGTWAMAQAIASGELFSPDCAVVQEFLQLIQSCDGAEGIPQDTGWMTEGAVWGYSAMFYAQAFLYAGQAEKAVDYLYSFANHASPGRCWREEQSLKGTQNSGIWGDMPHNWSSAEFIRLVRNIIVYPRHRNLYILEGLPQEWLPTEANPLVIEETPTNFGKISVQLEFEQNAYHLTVNMCLHDQPERVYIRVPDGLEASEPTEQSYISCEPADMINMVWRTNRQEEQK